MNDMRLDRQVACLLEKAAEEVRDGRGAQNPIVSATVTVALNERHGDKIKRVFMVGEIEPDCQPRHEARRPEE